MSGTYCFLLLETLGCCSLPRLSNLGLPRQPHKPFWKRSLHPAPKAVWKGMACLLPWWFCVNYELFLKAPFVSRNLSPAMVRNLILLRCVLNLLLRHKKKSCTPESWFSLIQVVQRCDLFYPVFTWAAFILFNTHPHAFPLCKMSGHKGGRRPPSGDFKGWAGSFGGRHSFTFPHPRQFRAASSG